MQKSPEWQGSHFENPQPIVNDLWAAIGHQLSGGPNMEPTSPPSTVAVEPGRFAAPPASGIRVTWLGHSTILLEVDGHRFLTDPVWSERVGPVGFAGPKRFFPPPLAIQDLPPVDAVLISHDHYDHLDYATIVALPRRPKRPDVHVCPLGVGAHLERWGVAAAKIIELDWWDSRAFGDLTLWAVPARHASGRKLFIDDGAKLWAGYAFISASHRVYYSGDTGLFPALRTIGDRLGPFDLTMIEIGQYDQAWPDWHLGPEQAIEAHLRVRGAVMLPVHWGLFALASHGWTEPIERAVVASRDAWARSSSLHGLDGASSRPSRDPRSGGGPGYRGAPRRSTRSSRTTPTEDATGRGSAAAAAPHLLESLHVLSGVQGSVGAT